MELRELTNEEFNKFTNNYSLSSIYQTIEYGLVMNKQKYESIFLGLINDTNDIVAASLVLIEKLGQFKYAYAPRGFLIDYTDNDLLTNFTNEIKKYLRKKNVIAIKISPLLAKTKFTPSINVTLANPSYEKVFSNLKNLKYYHLGYNNYFEAFKPRFEAVVELNQNVAEMFNKLNDDFQSKIHMCDLAGIRIYKGNEKILDYLYEQVSEDKDKNKEYINDIYYYFNRNGNVDIFFAQLETKEFLINTQIEYQKQINICNKITDELFKNQGKANNDLINQKIIEDNKLSNIKKQLVYSTKLLKNNPYGIIIASAMIIKHGSQLYLIMDGINEEYKHFCPKHLLIWKIIEKYAFEGYKELNLGAIANPTMEKNEYQELNDFKLNFNASAIEYAGDFELVTNFPLYTLYRNSAPIRKVLKK